MNTNCQICSGPLTIYLSDMYDDRYGFEGYFRIMKCSRCGHKSLDTSFTSEQISRLYTDFYPRSSFDVKSYRPAKEVKGFLGWLNGGLCQAYSWVPRNVRILDIGCGFGESLAYHRARGCDVYGVETDENVRRIAEKFGFPIHIGTFDPSMYDKAFFDYITLDQVIEHFPDPIKTMRGIAEVLKTGGVAIISTPNASGRMAQFFKKHWIHWHVPYHMQFFSPSSMASVAEQAGLIVEKTYGITSSEWLHYQWLHSLTCPPPGVPSPFWSHKGRRNFKAIFLLIVFSLFHHLKVDHIITRMIDAIDEGDNLLYFCRKVQ